MALTLTVVLGAAAFGWPASAAAQENDPHAKPVHNEPSTSANGTHAAHHVAHAPRGAKSTKATRAAKSAHVARRAERAAARTTVADGPLPAPVLAALQRAHVPLSSISVVVDKIGAERPLIAWNANDAMQPASTMKLVTTYTGLSILGPDYRWRTSAYADGAIDPSGALHGNLYIQGTGDPKLVPEELIDLVDKIHKQGITSIDGDLVLDKRFFAPSTRDLPPFDGDANAPYNVGPDPLLYAFKSLSFTLTPSRDGSVAIEVTPALAQLQIVDHLRATRGACVGSLPAASPTVTPSPEGNVQALFHGDYPLRCGERTVNVATLDHSAFFSGGFLALWQQTGGTFRGTVHEGPVPDSAKLVAVHHGPELSDIVRDINKFSNNTMARNLFLTIGAVGSRPVAARLPQAVTQTLTHPVGDATPEKSAAVIRDFLARSGIAMPELALDNGSGLSRTEHISAGSLAALLRSANGSPVAQAFTESLPIAGVDGTMRRRLTHAPVGGNAHIKTGTLDDVRAIAGYVSAANGDTYVVVSLINAPNAHAAGAAHDALLEWVYRDAR